MKNNISTSLFGLAPLTSLLGLEPLVVGVVVEPLVCWFVVVMVVVVVGCSLGGLFPSRDIPSLLTAIPFI